jgi:hypothetical protein
VITACSQIEKAKPFVRWGRKATGLALFKFLYFRDSRVAFLLGREVVGFFEPAVVCAKATPSLVSLDETILKKTFAAFC